MYIIIRFALYTVLYTLQLLSDGDTFVRASFCGKPAAAATIRRIILLSIDYNAHLVGQDSCGGATGGGRDVPVMYTHR